MRKHSKLIWGVIALLLMALTVRTIFRVSDSLSPRSFAEALRSCSKPWLLLSALAMAGFIVLEGETLLLILRGFGYRRGQGAGLVYSASDIYFSAITPSASGGQPASAFFMYRDGIPGAVVTVTLLVNLIAYTAATMAAGAVALLGWWPLFRSLEGPPRLLVALGMAILAALMALFFLLLRRGGRLLRLGIRFLRFLGKKRLIRHEKSAEDRLQAMVRSYERCADMTRGKWRRVLGACFLNFCQRLCQITVTVLVHLSFHGPARDAGRVWAASAFAQVGSNFLPVPGGMGAADYLLFSGFHAFMPREAALRLGLFSRTVGFYLCMLLSGLISLIGYLALRKRKDETNDRHL